MPPRTVLLAVHNTTTAWSTEAREVYCRWSITRTSGVGLCQRAAGGPCYGTHFRPLGVVEDVSSRKDSYLYLYSCLCSCRLAYRARQHDSSCIISIPPYCGSSSSSSGRGGGGAERAGAVACVDRVQQQQQQQPRSCLAAAAVAIEKWKLVLVLMLFIFVAQTHAASTAAAPNTS